METALEELKKYYQQSSSDIIASIILLNEELGVKTDVELSGGELELLKMDTKGRNKLVRDFSNWALRNKNSHQTKKLVTEFYRVHKNTDIYRYAIRLFKRDLKGMNQDLNKLIGFEANKNVNYRGNHLEIRKEALEEFRPEWLPLFYGLRSRLSEEQKIELDDLNKKFLELQEKYNARLSLYEMYREWELGIPGSVVPDFDSTGYFYLEVVRRDKGNNNKKDLKKISEVEFLERKIKYLQWKDVSA